MYHWLFTIWCQNTWPKDVDWNNNNAMLFIYHLLPRCWSFGLSLSCHPKSFWKVLGQTILESHYTMASHSNSDIDIYQAFFGGDPWNFINQCLYTVPTLTISPPPHTHTHIQMHAHAHTQYIGTHTHTHTHLYWNSVVQLQGKLLMWLKCTEQRKMQLSSSSVRGRKTFQANWPLFFLQQTVKESFAFGWCLKIEGSSLKYYLSGKKLSSF